MQRRGKMRAGISKKAAKTDRDRGGGDETPDVFGRTNAASRQEQGAGSVAHDETTEPASASATAANHPPRRLRAGVPGRGRVSRADGVDAVSCEQPDNSAPALDVHGIAALATTRRWAAPLTRTIPHFIDREALNARANAFERKLRAGGAIKDRCEGRFSTRKFDKMLTTITPVA